MALTIGNSSTVLRIINSINKIDKDESDTMTRLTTGNRINKASDDPAGLVALTSLNSELAGVNAAIDNNTRSQGMLDVADSTLTEVSSLTAEIEDLVQKASGSSVSASEKAAYQSQIDESIDAIDRLVNTASYNGKALFNGENRIGAYTNSTASVKNLEVYRRDPNVTGTQTLTVAVTAAATRGSAVSTFGTAATLSAATTIQVTGKLGTATISLSNGMTGTQIMAAVVAQKSITGVSALAQGTNCAFMSTTTGSDAFVAIQTLDGSKTFSNGATVNKTSGVDAKVKVNGEFASTQGTEVYYSSNGVSLSFNLAKNAVNAGLSVSITGGGATFQVNSDSSSQAALNIAGVNAAELGRSDLGYLTDIRSGGTQSLSVTGNKALEIARKASTQVASTQARLGSFNKYQIGSTLNVLESSKEALTASVENIQLSDYTEDTAALQRQQVLMQAATSVLALANSKSSNILSLF